MTYSNTMLLPQVGSSYGFGIRHLILPRVFRKDSVSTIKLNLRSEDIRKCHDKLNRIEALGDNWNGYGAVPISKELVKEAKRITKALRMIPQVYPTADGTLQFEYEKKDGSYLEISLSDSETVGVFEISKDKTEKEYQIEKTVSAIDGIVKNFYGF